MDLVYSVGSAVLKHGEKEACGSRKGCRGDALQGSFRAPFSLLPSIFVLCPGAPEICLCLLFTSSPRNPLGLQLWTSGLLSGYSPEVSGLELP